MEILPLGPVVITDTAGIDDTPELGKLRMEKTEEVVKKINLAVYVLRTDEEPTADDMHWLGLLNQNNVPIALFINEINAEIDKEIDKENDKENNIENKTDASTYVETHKGLSELATVIGSADFTSKVKRLELLDLLGGLTPLDVEGDQTLLQGIVEERDTIILYVLSIVQHQRAVLFCHSANYS